ncbi:PH domain-containing protein [Clostridium collagenovorans DSM 3089]|uniref:PH domain-containing protein n=1 Tax=Clostridium collagenovorans DSM 3089 TaxID=1121306 RepID=A0A1M5SH55_9CLOT|nr:PH domain-containing protein [Clostridium collagenovorans]SHH37932.1 PH domain-containing protein [Clostridium collagenovorans DSM 3089]
MIDFQNASYLKLKPVDPQDGYKKVAPLLIDGENIFAALKSVRDMVIFTDKRIIAVNVQGMLGSKVDYTSLPYSKVQAFSVETAGTFDLDCELELWFSSLGKVKFEIKGNFDIRTLSKLIGNYIL